jgi:hypothetical protein
MATLMYQWFTSCTDEACSDTKKRLYDPTLSSKTTGSTFNIGYLQGNVVGPVVWDQVQLGAYSINFQALGTSFCKLLDHCLKTLFNFITSLMFSGCNNSQLQIFILRLQRYSQPHTSSQFRNLATYSSCNQQQPRRRLILFQPLRDNAPFPSPHCTLLLPSPPTPRFRSIIFPPRHRPPSF